MLGCSKDRLEDQAAFAAKYDFRFPLIADPDGQIIGAYDALRADWGVAGRATVIVGLDGKVAQTFPEAPLGGAGHAQEVLEAVEATLG